MKQIKLLSAILVVAVLVLAGCTGTAGTSPNVRENARVVMVPGDADTVQAGIDQLQPGDMLLIGAGVYPESVVVSTPDVTIRGEDRNDVIFDGGGTRSQGILVIADGVRIQNLTVHSYLYNGVLVTGLHDGETGSARGFSDYTELDTDRYPPIQRYAVEYVTAYNNGLYGVYAFNAQHGAINNTYTSGSADSGIYVGQCRGCDAVISDNVSYGNAVGFENANASGTLTVVGNRFSGNRVGMTLLSNYQEAFTPQRGNIIVGNVISGNDNVKTPAQADGAFGIGIGVGGGTENDVRANLISDQSVGVLLRNTEDLPALDNSFTANTITGHAIDVLDASASRAPASGNCVAPTPRTIVPAQLGDPGCAGTVTTAGVLPIIDVPAGQSFLRLPAPAEQPQIEGDINAIPARLPDELVHPDPDDISVPSADLLADRIAP